LRSDLRPINPGSGGASHLGAMAGITPSFITLPVVLAKYKLAILCAALVALATAGYKALPL